MRPYKRSETINSNRHISIFFSALKRVLSSFKSDKSTCDGKIARCFSQHNIKREIQQPAPIRGEHCRLKAIVKNGHTCPIISNIENVTRKTLSFRQQKSTCGFCQFIARLIEPQYRNRFTNRQLRNYFNHDPIFRYALDSVS